MAVEVKLAPRSLNYAKASAKSKSLSAAAPRIPDPEVRSEAGHMLIIFSREIDMVVDRIRKARNQKLISGELFLCRERKENRGAAQDTPGRLKIGARWGMCQRSDESADTAPVLRLGCYGECFKKKPLKPRYCRTRRRCQERMNALCGSFEL
ncbi:hypothetical protein EVAR_2305_1 [Eumeta japonica]|uniref:Uncharacterized protein n=1 Tax=Eumeta variegata TaxID=151549 RepID=A0A4C1SIR8_EUMVA|nr:hypothetical protein EVAR_2305_1 [Eumeta japonica]